MFVRFEHVSNRIAVQLLHNRRVGKKVHTERLGGLGTVPLQFSVADRLGFWATFDSRWQAICGRHPHLTDADRDKVRRKIDERIPGPRTENEMRLMLMAKVWVDAVSAVEAQDAGLDGVREASKQFERLAAEVRREKRKTETEM